MKRKITKGIGWAAACVLLVGALAVAGLATAGCRWKVPEDVLRRMDLDEMASCRERFVELGFEEVERDGSAVGVAGTLSQILGADAETTVAVALMDSESEALTLTEFMRTQLNMDWTVTAHSRLDLHSGAGEKRFLHVISVEGAQGAIEIIHRSDWLFSGRSEAVDDFDELYRLVMGENAE